MHQREKEAKLAIPDQALTAAVVILNQSQTVDQSPARNQSRARIVHQVDLNQNQEAVEVIDKTTRKDRVENIQTSIKTTEIGVGQEKNSKISENKNIR